MDPNLSMETKDTGKKGVLYVQDSGSYIYLGLRVKDSSYTKSGLSFTWSSPTSKGSKKNITLPAGGDLKNVTSFSAPLSGEVVFTMKATGTSELGGPTTIKYQISRSESIPNPPIIEQAYMSSATAAYIYWNIRETGGSNLKVTRFDLGYGTSDKKPTTIIKSASAAHQYSGSRTVTGLTANTTYYFFTRAVNKEGVGEWSEPRGVITSGGVLVKYKNEWRYAEPYVKHVNKWKRARAYVKRNGAWKMTR